MIKHLLFDLDGTLLPLTQDDFVNYYFGFLCKRFEKFGFEPKRLVKSVWKGTAAMVLNDGSKTNEQAFWDCFCAEYGIKRETYDAEFLDFYTNEFNKAIAATRPTPLARQVVDTAHAKGYDLYLATNPIFPRVATLNRIHWAGLRPEDFVDITTYEVCRYSKPNPEYFREICQKHALDPRECLMVGNDAEEDLASAALGMTTYIVTDCLENKKNLPLTADYSGTMAELAEFIAAMPTIEK